VPKLTAIAWNLFHGRDFPPDPRLFTWRSRLLRISERNATHLQVNRGLLEEFGSVLGAAEWDVALLQESPPRFAVPLARACGAQAHRALTSRNGLGALRGAAARFNPDLIASNEGGSNLTLVRVAGALGPIEERREVTIHAGRPERRAMALTRTAAGVCVANLHASTNAPRRAIEDVLLAAREATRFAGEAPLLLGGDLNLRPRQSPEAFEALAERFGLRAPTGPDAIDHLLVRGMDIVSPAAQWPPGHREVEEAGLAIRLSDHAPVKAVFETAATR
jgi:endonuclease/exonuclease/phosphatase family metal-dependent hydrolase